MDVAGISGSCPKCGKQYKLRAALEKHAATCVPVVRKAALPKLKDKANKEGLVTVSTDLPEPVVKKIRKSRPKAQRSKEVMVVLE